MGRRPQTFGGNHTELKLDVVIRYLGIYATALKNTPFRLSYVDAFAGSGWRTTRSIVDGQGSLLPELATAKGSALRVLEMPERLHRYVFNDINAENVESLRAAVAAAREGNPALPQPIIKNDEANEFIAEECRRLAGAPTDRVVMFLDPFGMQVRWRSLELIAMTGKVDLWMLFPTGAALNRLMSRTGDIPKGWEPRLAEYLGDDWRSASYAADLTIDMFDQERETKTARLRDISQRLIARLRSLFGDGTHPTGLSLSYAGQGGEAYLLAFACANRDKRAYELALKFAKEVIRYPRGH